MLHPFLTLYLNKDRVVCLDFFCKFLSPGSYCSCPDKCSKGQVIYTLEHVYGHWATNTLSLDLQNSFQMQLNADKILTTEISYSWSRFRRRKYKGNPFAFQGVMSPFKFYCNQRFNVSNISHILFTGEQKVLSINTQQKIT